MPRNVATTNALRLVKRLDAISSNPDVTPAQRALLRRLLAEQTDDQPTTVETDETALRALLAKLRQRGERRSLLYVVR